MLAHRPCDRMALSVPTTSSRIRRCSAAVYAGSGVQSPFLPALLQEYGLSAEAIGVVLAAGTAIRLTRRL